MQCRHVAAVVFGGMLFVSSLAGCTGQHRQASVSHEAPASAASAGSHLLDPEASAALAGYRASWVAIDEATHEGNYQLPALAEHLAGDEYLLVTQNLYAYMQNGVISKGAVVLHPRVKSEDLAAKPPTVTIADCVDGRNDLLYDKTTGKPIDSDPGGFRTDSTVMSEIGGIWMATSDQLGADGTCTPA